MINDKTQPNLNDRPEQTKPEEVDEQEKPSQTGAVQQPHQRAAPGRRPLFRS